MQAYVRLNTGPSTLRNVETEENPGYIYVALPVIVSFMMDDTMSALQDITDLRCPSKMKTWDQVTPAQFAQLDQRENLRSHR